MDFSTPRIQKRRAVGFPNTGNTGFIEGLQIGRQENGYIGITTGGFSSPNPPKSRPSHQ